MYNDFGKEKNINVQRLLLIGALILTGCLIDLLFVICNIVLFIISLFWLFNKGSSRGLKLLSFLLIALVIFSIVIVPILGNIISDKVDWLENQLEQKGTLSFIAF